MSNSFQSYELQHTRLPCSSLSPGVWLNSCPLSQWCHLIISSSLTPFSSCSQSFPASGSLPVSWLFPPGGQRIEDSALASILPMNVQAFLPLGLTSWISLLSKGLFSSTAVWKHQFFSTQSSLWSNSHIHTWILEKSYLWLYRPLLAKWCLCFLICCLGMGFPGSSAGKESTCNAGNPGSIPGLGKIHGGGHGNLFQYSCLENNHGQRSMMGYSHGVTESLTWLSG